MILLFYLIFKKKVYLEYKLRIGISIYFIHLIEEYMHILVESSGFHFLLMVFLYPLNNLYYDL